LKLEMKFAQKLLLGAACASITVSAVAAPAEPLRLKPSSKWVSDYRPDGCRLLREFGEGDDQVLLQMSRFAPTDGFSMTVSGKKFSMQKKGKASVQFGPNEAEQNVDYLPGTMGKLSSLVMSSDIRIAPLDAQQLKDIERTKAPQIVKLAPIGSAREKAVTYLKIGKPLRKPVILELGAMDKPFAALSTCITDLVTSWGLDAEKHKNLVRWAMPSNNPGDWIRSSEYPSKMLDVNQPAIVEFRLEVDETGNATQCHIQQTTRPKDFDTAVCKGIMKRAKFTPALDAEGKPLRSYYQNTVRFQPFG
jgi:Gram-negative bacterial TonB protein C-terminal